MSYGTIVYHMALYHWHLSINLYECIGQQPSHPSLSFYHIIWHHHISNGTILSYGTIISSGTNIYHVMALAPILSWMNEWTDTSLRYRHWRMCFERLLQAFARWQPGNLFDIAAQPILEYRWIYSYTQLSLRTQFKVATVYSIHTQSLSWCSTWLVPNVLPRRDEGSGKPCAVDRAS